MDFGEALKELRAGRRMTRAGWQGDGMSVYLEPARGMLLAYLSLRLPRPDPVEVPWTASQTDVLADDWDVLE